MIRLVQNIYFWKLKAIIATKSMWLLYMHFAFVNFKHDFSITSDQLATFFIFSKWNVLLILYITCCLNFMYSLL